MTQSSPKNLQLSVLAKALTYLILSPNASRTLGIVRDLASGEWRGEKDKRVPF